VVTNYSLQSNSEAFPIKPYLQHLVAVLLITLSPLSPAQTYSNPGLGFSITIDDYFSQQSQEGSVYYFTSEDNASTVIIKNWPGLSIEEVRQAGKLGYQDEGIALTASGVPTETPMKKGWGLTVDVDGFIEQARVKGILGGFVGNKGQGFIILVAATPESWPQIKPRSQAIFNSIGFIRFSGGQDVTRWRQYLTGMRLAYRSTHGGGSSREDYYLCSDGSFMQSGGTSNYSAGGGVSVYGQASNRGAGHWQIQTINGKAHIIFNYHGGARETALLEDDNGKTLLNGSRYFVVENDRCR
jgi:hypothetical protein